MDLRPFNVLSLFSGGAGLDLGVKLAVPSTRVVCYVEREAFACATLVRQMEKGGLDPCPVWTDVATFDGHPWRGIVDLVAGGFPCQDISCAGNGEGIDGRRSGLWSEFARIVGEVRPVFVFVENVAALATRGLDRVAGDLAALGFDSEWGVFRASDAGAPHGRCRLFLLAHTARQSDGQPHNERQRYQAQSNAGPASEGYVADPRSARFQGTLCAGMPRGRSTASERRKRMAHTQCQQREQGRRISGAMGKTPPEESGRRAVANGEGNCPWPPGPDDAKGWEEYLQHWPGTEPALRRGADGLANRVDRLRLLGNGVVPQQAAFAFRVLWGRLMTQSLLNGTGTGGLT